MSRAFHDHHRRKGDRSDNRPVNILRVDFEVHDWIEKHPEEARELGWSVSRYEEPENVSVVIPKSILATPEKKPRKKSEPAKKRTVISVRVPKEVTEDGEEVLTTLIEEARKKLAPEFGWSDSVGSYYVLTAALAAALQG